MDFALQILSSGLTNGAVYGLLALGFNLIFNTSGIINFSQGEFFAYGALIAISLGVLGLPLLATIPVSIIIVVLMALLLERLLIRRVLLRFGSFLTAWLTAAIAFALEGIIILIWGRDEFVGVPFTGRQPVRLSGASISQQSLWTIGVLLLVCIVLWFYLYRTRSGKAIRACAENRDAASLMGIDAGRMISVSFALSAAIGAIAGIAISPLSYVSYSSGLGLAIKGFVASILGGMGSVFGAIAGGFAIGLLEAFSGGYLDPIFSNAIVYSVGIVLLLFRPTGIMGRPIE